MFVDKKRKYEVEEGKVEVADGDMQWGAVSATKVPARPKRTSVENQFSRSQEAHAEHFVDEVMQMYKSVLTHDNVPTGAVQEVRRLLEEIHAKYSPSMGDVFLTGSSDCCQLGLASQDSVSRLTLFNELVDKDIVHVTCGSMSNFVLDRQGRVYSWGSSDKGALARRTDLVADPETEFKAERVTGFNPSKLGTVKIPAANEDSSISQVVAGAGHVLFLSNTGAVYVAGSYLIDNKAWREEPPPDQPDKDNTLTELYEGAAPLGFREEPRHVYRMPQLVDQIYAGSSMSAARLADGTLVTWGCDAKGELGRGTPAEISDTVLNPKDSAEKELCVKIMKDDFLIPKPVKFSHPMGKHVVLDVACGQNHMLVVVRLVGQSGTRVYGTGLNQYGQLGLGDEKNRNELTLIPDSLGKNIISVSAGLFHSMFLSANGYVIYTCGRCDSGQLGIEDKVPEVGDFRNRMQVLPIDIKDPDEDVNFKQIAAGENSCFAVTRTGKLYSWGFGESGQLGHGRNADQLRATAITKYAKDKPGFVLEVASGSQHTIVLINREMGKNDNRGPSDRTVDN